MTGGFEPGGIAGAGLGGSVAGVVGTGEDVAPVAVAEEPESVEWYIPQPRPSADTEPWSTPEDRTIVRRRAG